MSLAKGIWFADAAMGFTSALFCIVLSVLPSLAQFTPHWWEALGVALPQPGFAMGVTPSWKSALALLFVAVGVWAAKHYYRVLVAIEAQSVDDLAAWLPAQQKASRWYWLLSITGLIYSGALLWGFI